MSLKIACITHTHHTNAVNAITETPIQKIVPNATTSDINRISPTDKNKGGATIAKAFQRLTWTGIFFIICSKSSILYLIQTGLELMCYF